MREVTKKLLLGQIYSHIKVVGTFIFSASKNVFFPQPNYQSESFASAFFLLEVI